jgi:hypothetical protein
VGLESGRILRSGAVVDGRGRLKICVRLYSKVLRDAGCNSRM